MKKNEIRDYLIGLRNTIVKGFESYEPRQKFEIKPWNYQHEGGGEISVLRGDVFEKAAVNFSEVAGPKFPLDDNSGPFYATGISLITHMSNPHVPTVHMNIRYIEAGNKWWLGGGYDLTPMGFPYEEDTKHFHSIAKDASGQHYEHFSKWASEYFYIPHKKRERGVGGLFFDYFNTGDIEADFALWRKIGDTFLNAITPIIDKRQSTPYDVSEKEVQNRMRAAYVEFNLLYDRGTKFGFQSGGNPEAILCSMPPTASW